jgi:hypothetical protein
MSAALAPSPVPEPRAPEGESARGVLLRLGAFVAALGVGSHLLLVGCRPLLSACERRLEPAAQPLRNEAALRLLRPGEAQLLVVGNSVVTSDVDAERLATGFGLDAVPLPLYGASSVDVAMSAPLLARARPRAVVVLVSMWAVLDRVDWSAVRVYDPGLALSLLSWRELLDERQAHAARMLESLHFVVRHREPLRQMAADLLAPRRRRAVPASGRREAIEERAARLEESGMAAATFTCPSLSTRALEAMAGRLGEAGVRTVLVFAPGNRRWNSDPALAARFDECLRGLAARTGSALVAREALPAFTAADFRDPEHMTRAGRERFTDALGARLRALLGLD